MSKRHFEAIAKALKSHKPANDGKHAVDIWEDLCKEVALICKTENDRFDRFRFLKACGLDYDAN